LTFFCGGGCGSVFFSSSSDSLSELSDELELSELDDELDPELELPVSQRHTNVKF
jgi:hypothetical protein